MADVTLSPTGLVQPEVGASADSWGTKLNDNFDTLNDMFVDALPTLTLTATGTPPTGVVVVTNTSTSRRVRGLVIQTGRFTISSKGTGGVGNVQLTGLTHAVSGVASASITVLAGINLTSGQVPTALISGTTLFLYSQSNTAAGNVDWSQIGNALDFTYSIAYVPA